MFQRSSLLLLTGWAVLAAAAPATAESGWPTPQHAASGAAFLVAAPAPAAGQVSVCVVDSGINDSQDLDIAYAADVYQDTPTDTIPGLHGTYVAQIAAAGLDGFGTVGIAPTTLRVVSIKALAPGATTFATSAYAAAINRCIVLAPDFDIRVIELSLGTSGQPDPATMLQLADRVTRARQLGINVVAAVGNDAGPVAYPAAVDGVLGVGAADPAGGPCAYANRGTGVDVTVRTCRYTAANPDTGALISLEGTSFATPTVAATLAALRAHRPDLSAQAAEQLITDTTGPDGALDAPAAFRAAGLGALVDAGQTAAPAPTPPVTIITPPGPSTTTTPAGAPGGSGTGPPGGSRPVTRRTLPRPRLRSVRLARGKLDLRVSGRPTGARLVLTAVRRRGEFAVTTRTWRRTADRLTLRPGTFASLQLRYEDGAGRDRPSAWVLVTPKGNPGKPGGGFEQ